MVVIDTNIVIAYFAEDPAVVAALEQKIAEGDRMLLPTIVKAETLSYPSIDGALLARMRRWFDEVTLIPLDGEIAERAADIRRATKLKLIDSIIAATATLYAASLVTRDEDFHRVPALEIVIW